MDKLILIARIIMMVLEGISTRGATENASEK